VKRGNAHAMYLLGALLLASPAGEPDPVRARPLLEKAATAGVPRAAYLLAVELAMRTPPDEAGARRWLESAAQFEGVAGVMYTTWVNDYSQLEAFLDQRSQREVRHTDF
jgi:TPR repeat protein